MQEKMVEKLGNFSIQYRFGAEWMNKKSIAGFCSN